MVEDEGTLSAAAMLAVDVITAMVSAGVDNVENSDERGGAVTMLTRSPFLRT